LETFFIYCKTKKIRNIRKLSVFYRQIRAVEEKNKEEEKKEKEKKEKEEEKEKNKKKEKEEKK
jgi:hypothetical protein